MNRGQVIDMRLNRQNVVSCLLPRTTTSHVFLLPVWHRLLRGVALPRDDHGHQYVYPQERAPELAKPTIQNVLSKGNEMTKNRATHSTSARDSRIQQMEKADVTGVSPSEERVEVTAIIAAKGEK